jgi:hypothetical protein
MRTESVDRPPAPTPGPNWIDHLALRAVREAESGVDRGDVALEYQRTHSHVDREDAHRAVHAALSRLEQRGLVERRVVGRDVDPNDDTPEATRSWRQVWRPTEQ